MKKRFALAFALLLASTPALAADDAPTNDEALVEKIVVRNRLFTTKGRFELGLNVGFSMLSSLTDHYNFTLTGAWNVLETLAIELKAGYAYSRHTSLADDIASQYFTTMPGPTAMNPPRANDLANLWEMTANGVIGLRWQPIYGKLGLMAELPVHFQFYVWVGGGAGFFKRSSVTICNGTGVDPDTGTRVCSDFFSETKASPIVSLALGGRFFVYENHAVRLEVRDYSYLDSYWIEVDRRVALNNGQDNPTGNGRQAPNPGITNLVQIDLGYTYIF